jgi:transposase
MKRERRSYDKEFKLMVVNLCHSGKSTKEVTEDLGIRPDMVRRWKREYKQYQEGSFSGHGKATMSNEQKEIAKLKMELKNAQIERDILKKAVGIFSRSDGKYFNS